VRSTGTQSQQGRDSVGSTSLKFDQLPSSGRDVGCCDGAFDAAVQHAGTEHYGGLKGSFWDKRK